jgi:hypothetical protein
MLMRGERMIASTGLAVAAIFLLSIAAAGAWVGVHTARRRTSGRPGRRLNRADGSLARSAESLLAADDLISVRTLLVTTAVDHRMDACQVRFADGTVVSDAASNRTGVRELPKQWPAGAAISQEMTDAQGEVSGVFPIVVPGKGVATLALGRRLNYSAMAGWEAQTGLGVIGMLGFGAVWVVYRRLRERLRALGAIREALVALERGETSSAGLAISAAFGSEAKAWNDLVNDRERLRNDLIAERAKESLSSRQGSRTDLAQACGRHVAGASGAR